MVLQTRGLTSTKVIDENKALPFELKLTLGSGYRTEKKVISRLTKSSFQIHQCLYDIKELLDLTIEVEIVGDEPVEIIWGSTFEYDSKEELNSFSLTRQDSLKVLYRHGRGDEYPWRCGVYHFELIYRDEKYYAGFRVVPKNVDDSQLGRIHETINHELEGLALDYLNYKKTFSNLSELEGNSYWQFLKWLGEHENQLLHGLINIEQDSQMNLKKVYQIENEPKHMDGRSIRWRNSVKGQIYQSSKFLNRRLIEHWDNDANRLVKYVVFQFTTYIDDALSQMKKIKVDAEKQFLELREDLNKLRLSKERINRPKITKDDKGRFDGTIKAKNIELKKLEQRLGQIRELLDQSDRCKKRLVARIRSPFWIEVSDQLPKRAVIGKNPSYQVLYRLWKEARALFEQQGDRVSLLPVHKPTFELYEYYVFLGVIQCFRELDFEPFKETLSDQLSKTFHQEGLEDGTRVVLNNDSFQIDVTYDEWVEPNDELALEKGTHFFSGGGKRKPDIRIDLYLIDEDHRRYRSTFILEIKYSPFHNIHQKHGKTKAMEQMDDYWKIRYVYMNNGEKDFEYNSVDKVVCVYPGDRQQPIKLNAGYGPFLQFYPNADSDGLNDIVGKNELKKMFEGWIEKKR